VGELQTAGDISGSVRLIAFPYLHSRSCVFVLFEICVIPYHVCLLKSFIDYLMAMHHLPALMFVSTFFEGASLSDGDVGCYVII
jgi:hypothetical protein